MDTDFIAGSFWFSAEVSWNTPGGSQMSLRSAGRRAMPLIDGARIGPDSDVSELFSREEFARMRVHPRALAWSTEQILSPRKFVIRRQSFKANGRFGVRLCDDDQCTTLDLWISSDAFDETRPGKSDLMMAFAEEGIFLNVQYEFDRTHIRFISVRLGIGKDHLCVPGEGDSVHYSPIAE